MTTERFIPGALSAEELALFFALEGWEVVQPNPPNVFDVIETYDLRLIGAYILRGFRNAAREGIERDQRVMELREFAYLAFQAADEAEGFLTAHDQRPDGWSALQAAVESEAGRDEGISQLAPRLRSAAVRVLDRLARVWKLNDEELAKLIAHKERDLLRWRENPDEVPNSVVECISALLCIFRAINTLLPQPSSSDDWLRRPNRAPLFGGHSALTVMLQGGLPAMRKVRRYLDGEIWGR